MESNILTGGLRPLERDSPLMPREAALEIGLEIAHFPARLDWLYPMRRATGRLTDDRSQGDAGEPVEMILVEPNQPAIVAGHADELADVTS